MKTDLRLCLNGIQSKNTQNGVITIIKKMEDFFDSEKRIEDVEMEELIEFISEKYEGKSETTISNTISRIKIIFRYFDLGDKIKDLKLTAIKGQLKTKQGSYFTPSEIYKVIESVENYQEKALVLLVYMGLYDDNFEAIRSIKRDNIIKNKLIVEVENEKNREIELNDYEAQVLKRCSVEEENVKYTLNSDYKVEGYALSDTPYLFRTKKRVGGEESKVSIPTMKKRVELIGNVAEVEGFTVMSIKNSRLIYDLVRMEFEENYGEEINQVALKDHMKDEHIKGCIEQLNVVKKSMRMKILRDIIKENDWFIK